jgi:hypothetical protein
MWQQGESFRDFLRALVHDRPEPGVTRRPTIDRNFQSNVPGLYIVGDLAGAPLLKTAIKQGVHVIRHLNRQKQNGNPGNGGAGACRSGRKSGGALGARSPDP